MAPFPVPHNKEEDSEGKLHPLLLEPVLKNLFKHMKTEELYTCNKVCTVWNEVSRPFRKPSELKVISSDKELNNYVKGRASGEIVEKYSRYMFYNMNLIMDIVRVFLDTHMEELEELRIDSSCKGAEYVVRRLQFPNLRRLIVDTPLNVGIVPNYDFGFGIKQLRSLTLIFSSGGMSTSDTDTTEVLAGLGRLECMDKLHIEGELSDRYPVFFCLRPHPGLKIRTLILHGSAMQLRIEDGDCTSLTNLELDGLHQLILKQDLTRFVSLKSLVLTKEKHKIRDLKLQRMFPELTALTVHLRGNRANTFLPMVFRMEKLQTLAISGDNIKNKMLCGKWDEIPSSYDFQPRSKIALILDELKQIIKPEPYIFNLTNLTSLTLESPMLTRTTIYHGLRYCDQLDYLKLKLNRNNRLNLTAMEVLGGLTNLDEFVLEYPERLEYTAEEIRRHLAICGRPRGLLESRDEYMKRFDNLPEVRRRNRLYYCNPRLLSNRS